MTDAGKRLLAWSDGRGGGYVTSEEVAAIEAEAVAAERARIRAAVEGIPTPKRHENDANGNWFTVDMEYGWECGVQAVLAILDGPDDD